jgi:hypothetical protein
MGGYFGEKVEFLCFGWSCFIWDATYHCTSGILTHNYTRRDKPVPFLENLSRGSTYRARVTCLQDYEAVPTLVLCGASQGHESNVGELLNRYIRIPP